VPNWPQSTAHAVRSTHVAT